MLAQLVVSMMMDKAATKPDSDMWKGRAIRIYLSINKNSGGYARCKAYFIRR